MSDKLLKIPTVSVVVVRDGQPTSPALNVPFLFTEQEIEQIVAGHDETALLDVNVAEAEAVIAAAKAAASGASDGKPAPRRPVKKDDDGDDL